MLPLIAALATQAAYTLVTQRDAVDDGLADKAEALGGMMVNVTGPSIAFDDDKAVSDALGFAASNADFAFAAALGADGRVIAFRGHEVELDEVRSLLVGVDTAGVHVRDERVVAATPVITDHKQIGTVYVGLRSDAAHAEIMSHSYWAAGISVLGIAIAIAVVQALARRIAQRNRQMRLVLDNVDEALVTINRDGTLERECSAAFERWFGAPRPGMFAAQIAGDDDQMRAMLALAWTELLEGVMPLEMLVDQFPSRLERGDRHFRIDLKPLIANDGAFTGALLRIRDITVEVEAQRTLAMQREYVAVFERALADPHGVREFMEDTGRLVTNLPAFCDDPIEAKRAAHTIKGNAATYGVQSVADVAHRLEDRMECETAITPSSVQELVTVWAAFATRVERLLGTQRDHVDISRAEIEALAELSERGGATAAERLRGLLLEPVGVRFEGFRRQIARVAERVGKPAPELAIDADGVRLPPDRLRPFWGAFAHLVRNALDHGVESEDVRRAAGKPASGRIELRARLANGTAIVEVADDGRGIDWERVRTRARGAGLPCDTHQDLERALFHDGLSTADAVSDVSGRGIGLAAVQAAVHAVGGTIAVASESGRGTRFTFTFPEPAPPALRRSPPTHAPAPTV